MDDLKDLFHFDEGNDEPIEYTIGHDGNSIIIDATEDAIDPVQDFIREKLMTYGRLAVEEIFVNIISYAYRPEVGKAEILCNVYENPLSVTIQFMDSGKPFDPLAVEEADTSGAMFLERPGGF